MQQLQEVEEVKEENSGTQETHGTDVGVYKHFCTDTPVSEIKELQ